MNINKQKKINKERMEIMNELINKNFYLFENLYIIDINFIPKRVTEKWKSVNLILKKDFLNNLCLYLNNQDIIFFIFSYKKKDKLIYILLCSKLINLDLFILKQKQDYIEKKIINFKDLIVLFELEFNLNLEEFKKKYNFEQIKILNYFKFSSAIYNIYKEKINKIQDELREDEYSLFIEREEKYWNELEKKEEEFQEKYLIDKLNLELELENANIKEYNDYILNNSYVSDQLNIIYLNLKENLLKSWNLMFKSLVKQKKSVIYNYMLDINKDSKFFKLLWKIIFYYCYQNDGINVYKTPAIVKSGLGFLLIQVFDKKKQELYMYDNILELGMEFQLYFSKFFGEILKLNDNFDLKGYYFSINIRQDIKNLFNKLPNNLRYKERLPMLIEPKDWSLNYLGGYLYNNNLIKNNLVKNKFKNNLEIKDKEYYNYINYLQKVVYIVNKEVYNFVYKNIIEIKKKLGFLLNKKELLDEYIRLGRLLLYQNLSGIEKKNLEKKKENLFKEWQELEKLEKNLYFLGLYFDVEEFYFPGRNDFRGRYYFDNNVLNLQNDKMIRGFIKFRYYSIFDLKWFKIAFISLYGIKLKTKDDYLIKFDELETEIIELNLDFIFNSENPWQILAYSLEYIDYLEWKADECNENKVYETNLPIFFDATCSVGQLVSLLVGNKKYLGALNLVEKGEEGLGDIYIVLIKEFLDGLNGLESEEDIILCKNLNKRISFTNLQVWRKYLKHTLMPIFYGLTDKGMRSNLIRDSNKLNLKLNIDLINFIWINLVKFKDNNSFFRVLFLINEVFEIEKIVALKFYVNNKGFVTNKQDNMMTLLLNYEEIDKKIIVLDKIIQGERIKKTATFLLSKGLVDNEKQLLALKANLIHTLDALWLHLTAIHCEKLGVKDLIPLFDCLGCQFGDIDKVLYSFKYALGAVFSNKEQFLNILINIKKSQNNGICTNEEKFRLKQLVEGYSHELNIDFLNLDYVVFP